MTPEPQRILMTGHNGYLGSVMAPHFVAAGHEVVGLDTDYFAECAIEPPADVTGIRRDLRELEPSDLEGIDSVIHLGALSNDPIGNLNDHWTEDINFKSTIRLAELAKEAGAKRFLFSSSCIMYGMSEAAEVDETSPLDPKTEYARSKVKAENALLGLADDGFSPVYLRNGTVYGLSPRMRFDTVLNDLIAMAVTTGKVVLRGDGEPWRPVIHVEDVCRAFQAALEAPVEKIHNQAFNTGADHLNLQIRTLAEIAVDAVDGAELEILGQGSTIDKRTYKASFAKWARTFPDFEWKWEPATGGPDLRDRLVALGITREDYEGKRYVRLRWLDHLREGGQLDESLRWSEAAVPSR